MPASTTDVRARISSGLKKILSDYPQINCKRKSCLVAHDGSDHMMQAG